jgi:mannose-6-phosphate isomerase-like protein (cupin superfamily)
MTALTLDLKEAAKKNDLFRKVLFTGANSQLVIMSIAPGEEIGLETHPVDQVLYVIDGEGVAVVGGSKSEFEKGDAVCVPAGERHNVVNTGHEPMKLVTVYSPPQHPAGLVQAVNPVGTTA